MVLTYLLGLTGDDEITPDKLISENGYGKYYIKGVGASYSIFEQVAKDYSEKYGINITSETFAWEKAWSDGRLMELLSEGQPVIFNARNDSVFTEGGHYIVLYGLTDDGKILVRDPNGANYNSQNPILKDGFENGFDPEYFKTLGGQYFTFDVTPKSENVQTVLDEIKKLENDNKITISNNFNQEQSTGNNVEDLKDKDSIENDNNKISNLWETFSPQIANNKYDVIDMFKNIIKDMDITELSDLASKINEDQNLDNAEKKEILGLINNVANANYDEPEINVPQDAETTQPSSNGEKIENTVKQKWDYGYLTAAKGVIDYHTTDGEHFSETWCPLEVNGLVQNIRQYEGIYYEQWTREDGVQMYGPYVMVAADVQQREQWGGGREDATYKYGDIVETSLGTGIVIDYCERSENERKRTNGEQTHFDIYAKWHDGGKYEEIGYDEEYVPRDIAPDYNEINDAEYTNVEYDDTKE